MSKRIQQNFTGLKRNKNSNKTKKHMSRKYLWIRALLKVFWKISNQK